MKVQLSIYERTLNKLDESISLSEDVIGGDLLRVLTLKEFETEVKKQVLAKVNEILDDVDCGCSKAACDHAEARDAYRFRVLSQICPRGGRNLRHSIYVRPPEPGKTLNRLVCDSCGADVTPLTERA